MTETTSSFFEGGCRPCSGEEDVLTSEQSSDALNSLPEWALDDTGNRIVRTVEFEDFYRTMAFVNAVAWIANTRDHHPDLSVEYGSCTVSFTTHKAGGLTRNDFICAAAVNRLLEEAEQE